MPVEERSLTSNMFAGEIKSLEIGEAYQLHQVIQRSRRGLYSSAKAALFSESRPKQRQSVVCRRVKPVGEPSAGEPHARFDEREVETEYGVRLFRHQWGNANTEPCHSLTYRVTSRRYRLSAALQCGSGTPHQAGIWWTLS